MKPRVHDPLRLDLAGFAAESGELSGEWAGHELPRLVESQTMPDDVGPNAVAWTAHGQERARVAGENELWLNVSAHTRAWLTCQRCLQPYEEPLDVDRWLRFVHGEDRAEALDAESDEDVLSLGRWLDLRELVEDELMLALPLVPLHARCPQPLPMDSEPLSGPAEGASHPFAALKSLKSGDEPKKG